MNARIVFGPVFAASVGCLVGIVGALGTIRADEPGVSKTKPEKGPSVAIEGGFMVPYSYVIPGTQIAVEMIPIPGGKVVMGSPESEPNRKSDEGPQAEVNIEPMWVAKTEVTWEQYKVFMSMYKIYKSTPLSDIRSVKASNRADAITVPTPLYEPGFTFQFFSDDQQPAVSMTQYAAKQYSKWISGLVGQQYRLPSEAEWEYAARANSTAAYCFGDDQSKLSDYAHFADNAPKGAGKVGTKLPNAFGLHDMHGNVWEWAIDGYTENGFAGLAGKTKVRDAVQWSNKPYPRTVRGGGWQDTADRLRSAARMGSNDPDWKERDPNEPNSPWWFTEDPARSVGFRLVRSLKPLSPEELKNYWEIDSEDIQLDVDIRLEEGRGALGIPSAKFSEEIKKANR